MICEIPERPRGLFSCLRVTIKILNAKKIDAMPKIALTRAFVLQATFSSSFFLVRIPTEAQMTTETNNLWKISKIVKKFILISRKINSLT